MTNLVAGIRWKSPETMAEIYDAPPIHGFLPSDPIWSGSFRFGRLTCRTSCVRPKGRADDRRSEDQTLE
jgi:hypothetical protein